MARTNHALDSKLLHCLVGVVFCTGFLGCSQIDGILPDSMSRTQKGVATGAAIGAVGGLIVGSTSGDAGAGAAIGAAAGAVAGGVVGNEFKKQDAEYAQREEIITRQSATIADQNRQIQELRDKIQDDGTGAGWEGAALPRTSPMAEEDLMAPNARFQMNEQGAGSALPPAAAMGSVSAGSTGSVSDPLLGEEYPVNANGSDTGSAGTAATLPPSNTAAATAPAPMFLDAAENTGRFEIPEYNRPSIELAKEGKLYGGSPEASLVMTDAVAQRAEARARARESVRGRLGMEPVASAGIPRIEDSAPIFEDEVPLSAPGKEPLRVASLPAPVRSAPQTARGSSTDVDLSGAAPKRIRLEPGTRYINPGRTSAGDTLSPARMPTLPQNSIPEPDIRTPTPGGMKIAKAPAKTARQNRQAKPYVSEPPKQEKKAEKKAAPAPKESTAAKKTPPKPKAEIKDEVPVVSIVESVDTEEALVPKDSNCIEGETEAERARNAASLSDKIFYYRRALRLCPKEPVYRIEMGRVYVDLNKEEEARFEFTKALELDPENEIAQDELSMLMLESSSNLY